MYIHILAEQSNPKGETGLRGIDFEGWRQPREEARRKNDVVGLCGRRQSLYSFQRRPPSPGVLRFTFGPDCQNDVAQTQNNTESKGLEQCMGDAWAVSKCCLASWAMRGDV